MSSGIVDQIEKQYTNFDNEELNKKFSGSSLKPPTGATYSQSREVAMENLKNLSKSRSCYGKS